MNAKEDRYAGKICQALDESAALLDQAKAARLAAARRTAVARRKLGTPAEALVFRPAHALAHTGASGGSGGGAGLWWRKLGMLVPLALLLAGLAGIYQWHQAERISEIADIDAAVLVDDLPLNAYLDKGFGQYLNKTGDE